MLTRWIPVHRAANAGAAMAARAGSGPPDAGRRARPSGTFPVPVVVANGVFAVATVVLVTLTAFGLISA